MELVENWQKTYIIRAKALTPHSSDTYLIWLIAPNGDNVLAYQEMSGTTDLWENQPQSDEEAAHAFIYQAFGINSYR